MEGALGDVLTPKSDSNHVFPRFRGGVVNVKGPIAIFHHIHVQLHPLWGLHFTGHLAFPSSFGIHCDYRILGGLQLLQICCWVQRGNMNKGKSCCINAQILMCHINKKKTSVTHTCHVLQ